MRPFLEATTNELVQEIQAANAANEAKSIFLAGMSHEICTPINAVLGLDEMILRESAEEQTKSYARAIQSPSALPFLTREEARATLLKDASSYSESFQAPNAKVLVIDDTPINLTANAISGAREYYLAQGFTDYLIKPIDSKKLEGAIASYLPREKLVLPGDAAFVKIQQDESNGTGRRENAGDIGKLIRELFGIDIASALKNCGEKEVFKEALRNFFDSIEEKASLIEEYAQKGEWKEYTILVHALKSSSRLICAAELSELAKELEGCGNNAQKSDAEACSKIAQKTPVLLEMYRAYLVKLAPLVGKTPAAGRQDVPKELISDEKLSDVREVVSVFDFDSADIIIAELDGYEIPQSFAEAFSKVKKAVANADSGLAVEILNDTLPRS